MSEMEKSEPMTNLRRLCSVAVRPTEAEKAFSVPRCMRSPMAARSVRIQSAAAVMWDERSALASVDESHSWEACSWEAVMVQGRDSGGVTRRDRAELREVDRPSGERGT